MKIAWIRYPQKLYTSGRVLRGGSEIANQHVIDWLRANGHKVIDFMPELDARIELISTQALGTPLMFQDLLNRIDEINSCDLVVTTNWFSVILPEIKIPICVIYHSSANMVLDAIKQENITDKSCLNKWLKVARQYDLASISAQSQHEMVIALGEQYQAKNSAKIIAVSQLLKEKLIAYYKIPEEKIVVVKNSYPVEWKNFNIDKNFSEGLKLINISRLPNDYNGFVGKGTDRLLEVLSKFPEIPKILLASAKRGVYDQILNDSIKNYELIENASRSQVKECLAQAHISIHTSRVEACQLTLIEAMLMKTMPITFNVGVVEELIENGKNGIIVNNSNEMASKIRWAIKNPQKVEQIAEEAQKTILEKLSIEMVGESYLEVFKKILGRTNA